MIYRFIKKIDDLEKKIVNENNIFLGFFISTITMQDSVYQLVIFNSFQKKNSEIVIQ